MIHCAAIVYIKSKYNPMVYEVNVNGTKNVIDLVLESGAKMVYVSSVHALPEKPNREVITEITDFDPEKVKGGICQNESRDCRLCFENGKRKEFECLYCSSIWNYWSLRFWS